MASAEVWTSDGRVAAVRLRARLGASELADGRMRLDRLEAAGLRSIDIAGTWMENTWDFIRYLPAQLTSDISRVYAAGAEGRTGSGYAPPEVFTPMRLREVAAVLGDNPVLVGNDATIDPYVVLDARNGPILVGSRAVIHSFTRLEGPCYIGADSTVMGGRVACSAVGENCKVSGEMSNTVVLGFSNKAHDGFLGHSYLGRWVNIGAGTITSNLKNTYGEVSMWTPQGVRQTGMQFLGSMFGDHARTGIGTTLATGTVVGAGANVFGGDMPPRYVPPFSWGRGSQLDDYQLPKFLEVAERVMSRRNVAVSAGLRRHFEEVHRHCKALSAAAR
jgi:UDP-N-acetylglucosamine diphosphorylase/glucosamine-1-phosphate N-acetyltransferase